ncbi:MAG: cytochrome C [Comamonas sp. SCN 65-56]|uniref:c-type cytochrome n=1 Tax=Comamonas sp. SCN 65-56 TaxID=1660095 RepID=UPI00086CD956|nr:c-type cytochrome [Comamonas sp. SCN 65-56]ODS93967.1 MAG: cytochrome C [Comamonas sp. SCN 65-56]
MKLIASLLMSAALAVTAVSALAQDATAKPDPAKGQATYGTTCAACHGADGNSMIPANPTLAQQFPEYLAKQLREFKAGKRVDAVMQGMASTLDEEAIRNVSAWLGTQKARQGFAKDKNLLATGERLYRGGAQDRGIAACAGCHSPNGAGIPAQFPRLSGQHEEYTAKQLVDFRNGTRANSTIMHDEVKYLTDHEIKALSDYIAGLR